jgi:hypothetical protein
MTLLLVPNKKGEAKGTNGILSSLGYRKRHRWGCVLFFSFSFFCVFF